MITDNKYIDIAHTISLNTVFEDGNKNYIQAMLEFAEYYHESELRKQRLNDLSKIKVCSTVESLKALKNIDRKLKEKLN